MADDQNYAAMRMQICRELFQTLLPEQGAALVGILYENRFVLKVPVWNPTSGKDVTQSVNLDPLEPQAAAVAVAEAFDLDCDDLFRRFVKEWGILKESAAVHHMKLRIRRHKLVECLVRCSP